MKSFPAWLKWLLPPVFLAALCLYAAWLFLPKGSGAGAVLAALAHPSAADLSLDQRVVLAVRLPRILTALLVGAAVAITGPIAFIGLLVPHLAKSWIGYDLRLAVPMSALLGALLGALLLVAADVLAIHLAYPAKLPAGAVLAIIGAPCFFYLLRRKH